jgi:hypothetical protein
MEITNKMGKIYMCVGKQTKFITELCENSSLKKMSFKTENTIVKLLKVNKNINKKCIKCGI